MASVEYTLSSRCDSLDALLGGGFAAGEITVVYGEARTGKTTLAIQTAIDAARRASKVLFIDADHSFTHQRFLQLAREDLPIVSEQILLFYPDTFSDQMVLVERIENYLTGATRLLIVDTVTSLYRVSLGSSEHTFALNRELNRQLAYLSQVALRRNIVVFLTSQVHAKLDFPFGRTEPVARRTLAHWPRTIIRLRNTSERARKEVIVERRRGKQIAPLKCPALVTAHGFESI